MENVERPIPDTIRHDEVRAFGFHLAVFTKSVEVYYGGGYCAGSGGSFEKDMHLMFFDKGLDIAWDRYQKWGPFKGKETP